MRIDLRQNNLLIFKYPSKEASIMKTNFKKIKSQNNKQNLNPDKQELQEKELSQEEFEEFVSRTGARGSFMIYRSKKKDDELGIDAL